jgi:hypothetical protein
MKIPLNQFLGVLLFGASIAGIGCSQGGGVVAPDNDTDAVAAETSGTFQASTVSRGGMIWSDCELFGTVGTPAHFKPSSGNFDELYNGANFMDGVGAISESKPGDQDFNGGRWHVNTLKEGVSTDKYANACSIDDIDPNDFKSTSTYFECPLLPRRGHSH